MSDRSGSRRVNYQVSGLRLQEVQRTLLGLGAPQGTIFHPFAKAIGEDFFEDRHDREENDLFFSDGLRKPELRRHDGAHARAGWRADQALQTEVGARSNRLLPRA